MNKAYSRINWENYPSDSTPLNETNLNKIDVAADEIDNRVIALNTAKFDKSEAQGLFKDVSLDRSSGVITFTLYNGATKTLDTLLERIAINFDYDAATQRLVITLDDGAVKYVDMSALITQYEFLDTDTVAFSIDSTGKVSALVKEGSIQEKHLQPNYLADIKVESAKAELAADNANIYETNAYNYATLSKSFAVGGTNSRTDEDTDNAKYYSEQAKSTYEDFIKNNVTGIKGNSETEYRHGDVNLTAENVGALPLTGGEMTGDIAIPKTKADKDNSIPIAGSNIGILDNLTQLSEYKSIIGAVTDKSNPCEWQNVISVRHRNGCGDGDKHGMYIRAPLTETGDLYWRQQYNGNWGDEKKLLDEHNYNAYCTPENIGAVSRDEFDGLQIGGRNLYTGTKDFSGSWNNTNYWTDDGTYNGFSVKKSKLQWKGIYKLLSVIEGEVYTISAYVKMTGGRCVAYGTVGTDGAEFDEVGKLVSGVTAEWKRVSATFKITKSGIAAFRFEQNDANQTIWVCGLKVEKGTKATDWSPALEDTENNIQAVENQVTTNLLKPTLKTTTINGVILTNNGDGTYTLNGTSTSTIYLTLCNLIANNDETLYLVGCKYFTSDFKIYVDITDGKGSVIEVILGSAKNEKVSVKKGYVLYANVEIKSGVVLDNVIIKPMLTTNINATYDYFVQYTGSTGQINSDVSEINKKIDNLDSSIAEVDGKFASYDTQLEDLTANIQQNDVIANISSSSSSNVSEDITILSKDYRAFIIVLCNGDESDHTVINTYTWLSSMVNGYYRLELYDPSNNVYIGYIEFQTNSIYVYLNKYDEYYVDIYGLISL